MAQNAPRKNINFIVNLWTLMEHPSADAEWTLEQKLDAIKDAGFDGVTGLTTPEAGKAAADRGLIICGYFSSGSADEFPSLLEAQKKIGAHHINVQMADHDTPPSEAAELAITLIKAGKAVGVEPAIEVHRDTCTETPEKTYAIAEGFEAAMHEPMPITWDFSHLAVVKHLNPQDFASRMLVRPDLIQRAQQFHCRPFNGHHCQVPVSDGRGNVTPEARDAIAFYEEMFSVWLQTNRGTDREIFVCPEVGPRLGGYSLSTHPSSWEDAKIMRDCLGDAWDRASASAGA